MTFASTITGRSVFGNKRLAWGTFTNAGGDTGGDIDTGLEVVEFMTLQTVGSAVSADQHAINETLPAAGSAITIVSTDDADGVWFAFGR